MTMSAAIEIARILIEFQIEEMKKADADSCQEVAAPAHSTITKGNGKPIVPQPEISSESPGLLNDKSHHIEKAGGE